MQKRGVLLRTFDQHPDLPDLVHVYHGYHFTARREVDLDAESSLLVKLRHLTSVQVCGSLKSLRNLVSSCRSHQLQSLTVTIDSGWR